MALLTNEDLLALSKMIDTKLDSQFHPIKNDIQSLSEDVHNVKVFQEDVLLPRLNTVESRVELLTEDMRNMKEDMRNMKEDMCNMKEDMCNMKENMCNMKENMCNMKEEMHNVKLFQENIILSRLNTIESCYTDTYQRYKNYVDRIDAAPEDVDLLKQVVSEHSETLRRIS